MQREASKSKFSWFDVKLVKPGSAEAWEWLKKTGCDFNPLHNVKCRTGNVNRDGSANVFTGVLIFGFSSNFLMFFALFC